MSDVFFLYMSFRKFSHCFPKWTTNAVVQLMKWAIIIVGFIKVGFIECKIDTNPPISPIRESRGTDMGRHLKSTRQGITKVGGMPA